MDTRDVELTPALLDALADLVYAELVTDRFRAACRHTELGLHVSRTTGHGYAYGRFTLGAAAAKQLLGQLHDAKSEALVTAELSAGRIDEAEAIARRIEEGAQGLGSGEGNARYARARIHLALGQLPDGRSVCSGGRSVLRCPGDARMGRSCPGWSRDAPTRSPVSTRRR
jgi:hypothetical protein